MSDDTSKILDGTNPKADARLVRDILKAEAVPEGDDMFDGGCPADVLPRPAVNRGIGQYQYNANELVAAQLAALKVHSAICEALRHAYHEADDKAEDAYDWMSKQATQQGRDDARTIYLQTCRYRDGLSKAWDIAIKVYAEL
jgi:hypothetical protein